MTVAEAAVVTLTAERDAARAAQAKAEADLAAVRKELADTKAAQAAAVKAAVDAERARWETWLASKPVAAVAAPVPIAVKLSGSEDTAPTYLARWQAFAGSLPALALWFLSAEGWDTATSQFGATSYHLPRAAKLGLPVIFALGLGPSPPGIGTAGLDSILTGARDAVFRRELAALNNFRPGDAKVYVRLGWECNGTPAWYAWSHDATKYKAAFRRVVGLARAVAPRIAIVWCVNALSADIAAWFPGADVVDVISFDHYPKAQNTAADFARARDHATAGFARIADFARAAGKPLAVDEWGALPDSGPWVDLFAAWIREQAPPLLWHGYWDNGPEALSTGASGTTGTAWLRNFRS